MKKWIVTFFIPFVINAYAETTESECSHIDLREESIGANRDQGKISWCYAFAAADMLQHHFKINEKISAADIALNYNRSTVGSIFDLFLNIGKPHETGFNKIALKQTMGLGHCPESVFPSETWIKSTPEGDISMPMPQVMKAINELHKNRKNLTLENLPFYVKFHNVDKETFLSLIKSPTIKKFYTRLNETVCSNNRTRFSEEVNVRMTIRNARIFQQINQKLQKNQLVGIDFDSRILKDAHHSGFKLSELHTTALVGRRWNQNKKSCEYLVRDSHGSQCTRYDPSYECEDGNVWLSESSLHRSMTSIVFLETSLR